MSKLVLDVECTIVPVVLDVDDGAWRFLELLSTFTLLDVAFHVNEFHLLAATECAVNLVLCDQLLEHNVRCERFYVILALWAFF